MAKIDINGIGIAYEILGEGKRTAVITPGGRFSKDTPGVENWPNSSRMGACVP